jgi:hypothetical protein
MTYSASDINKKYLESMLKAPMSEKSLFRIRELWWESFTSFFDDDPDHIIDNLDICMSFGREALVKKAREHASSKGFDESSAEFIQRITQFMKSNTGKMFERFIGLAIAYYLFKKGSKYAIWPFRDDITNVCSFLNKNNFKVHASLFNLNYTIPVDCDLICFNPRSKDADIYMISVKSTLKDRFHNVPFWNLLRLAALKNTPQNLIYDEESKDLLTRAKYVAVCSDLAKEQPDFSKDGGPRNLLCLDAALLDGAYVTASTAKGLGVDNNHLGPTRSAPFFPLSSFVQYLSN